MHKKRKNQKLARRSEPAFFIATPKNNNCQKLCTKTGEKYLIAMGKTGVFGHSITGEKVTNLTP